MNQLRAALRGLLRGAAARALLRRLNIDPVRFWLLADLFAALCDRGEMLDQLGRNGVALKGAAWLYFAFSVVVAAATVATRVPAATYLLIFLCFTALILLMILLSETANSLVNPVEGLVLAHQPINGATYTAAKLTHLAGIVLYLVAGMNAVPALAGVMLVGTRWWYPLLHFSAALVVGAVVALLCCALFGWLIRFVPARRLKAAGQFASTVPFFALAWSGQLGGLLRRMNLAALIPSQPAVRWGMAVSLVGTACVLVVLGIRSLSADYLLRVSSIVHGGAKAGSKRHSSWIAGIVARYFGGQPGRAGYAFVSRLMLRDWQARRQIIPLAIPALIGFGSLIVSGNRVDPFSRQFAPAHLMPHMLGLMLAIVCTLLPYGSDYKGSWLFLLAPSGAMGGFARGVYALLWIDCILIPHAIAAPLIGWRWGFWHAALFTAWSAAAASIYLALELRLIEGAPFSRQPDASRGAVMMPVMILGGMVIAIAVGLQYYFIFRSEAIVIASTAAAAATAYFATRASLNGFATSIRYHLGLASAETGTFYKEIDA